MKKTSVMYGLVVALSVVLGYAGNALAVGAFDFTTIATAISTEITNDLPVFATIMGIVVGIPLVWSLFKRMAR